MLSAPTDDDLTVITGSLRLQLRTYGARLDKLETRQLDAPSPRRQQEINVLLRDIDRAADVLDTLENSPES